MSVALPSYSGPDHRDGQVLADVAGIEKTEVVGVVEQAPGHETTGDDGLGLAEAGNGVARGHTFNVLALVLFGAAALHVATVVLVEPGKLIKHEHWLLHGLGDDQLDVATVVGSGVLDVVHWG